MKNALALILFVSSFAKAELIVCSLDGKLNGITRIDAHSGGSETTEYIYSVITRKNQLGQDVRSEQHMAPGILNQDAANFEIAPVLESGPFGIKKAFIVYDGNNFSLEIRNYCNFYYQEEKCSDGDLLETLSSTPVRCSINQ